MQKSEASNGDSGSLEDVIKKSESSCGDSGPRDGDSGPIEDLINKSEAICGHFSSSHFDILLLLDLFKNNQLYGLTC